ncbi:MAG TPA: GDSL-type esterase/lipase family protein, partial [Fimbriimonas sp.]|nr:GDSL-type esterase/lipase family protein [Fimbriimonas sp.]
IQFKPLKKTITVRLQAETGDDYWQVDVDGRAHSVLHLDPAKESYTIDLPSANVGAVTLVKRTEAFSGKTIFRGFGEPGSAKSLMAPSRKILIIGDSISAGFGVDGKKAEEPFMHSTSNAYMTYGWVAARAVKADVTITAWSGKKMWPDNTIPEIFDYALPNSRLGASETHDDSSTQAVLINLATNDFGQKAPDEKGWTTGYVNFVKKVRGRFPNAYIYLATGSMMSDNWPPEVKHLSTVKRYLESVKTTLNDDKVRRIDFATQLESDGIGSSWHPNVATNVKMAKVFTDALRRDLGW